MPSRKPGPEVKQKNTRQADKTYELRTAGGAQEMADNFAAEQVTLAMVPVCLGLSEADAERASILATLQEASSFQRRTAMMETGWATMPGTDAPSRDLASACLAELELDGS